ncbi:MAG: hypothetical protein A2X42_12245 [Candidatus Margulisbacteria bacterium GWF2_38_17]|nr:MAG: hypothetical protein A2X42_12245 [Candidatus Margulisbacteria bacterium GWF2_38_17]
MRKLSLRLNIFTVFLLLTLIISSGHAIAKIPPDLLTEYNNNKKYALQNQNNAELWYSYAMTCAYIGKVEEGLDALKKVDAADPNYAKKMTPVYKEKIEADPQNWKTRFYYAFSVYALTLDRRKKNISKEEARVFQEEAFGQFKDITHLLGDKNFVSAWAYGYMGAIRGEQEKFDEAIGYLKKGLKIEPDGTALHMALGYAYMKRGNWLGFVGETLTVGRLKAEEQQSNQNNEKSGHEQNDI